MASPKKEAALAVKKSSTNISKATFGDVSPWGEPAWCNSLESPYYGDSHLRLRDFARKYIDENILPHALEWEEQGGAPREEALKFARSGLAFTDIPVEYRPDEFQTIAGIPVGDLDVFHNLILMDEMSRVEGGVMISLAGASGIGVPPIVNYGTEEQKRAWLPKLFSWEFSASLGITEPTGGSDVSNIRTTAKKTADGKFYVVNGNKKWITGTPWATHMTTAVRTGEAGLAGVSLLVIPLDLPGISTRKIINSGQNAGGSSWVTLEDVKVPVENLLGQENKGFAMIMNNFNKERYILAVQCNRKARTCLSLSMAYAYERETFGQPLVANQIIRAKFTDIARYVESHWAWLEQIAFHIKKHGWQSPDVGGSIALAKVHGGRLVEQAAREAQQVFGGKAYERGGASGGGIVEQINRDLRMLVVGGGSDEILGELGFKLETKRSKQAMKL